MLIKFDVLHIGFKLLLKHNICITRWDITRETVEYDFENSATTIWASAARASFTGIKQIWRIDWRSELPLRELFCISSRCFLVQ